MQKTAWILVTSTFSLVSTASTISFVWVQFLTDTDTKDTKEVWTAEYRSLEEARASIARWIEEYNHDRPHRGVGNRAPHEAFLAFAVDLKTETLNV
jgi:transposase InsO family protein